MVNLFHQRLLISLSGFGKNQENVTKFDFSK